jgi:phosphoserine aminotransferase
MTAKPDLRPHNPRFSSGPCAKRPGWTLDALSGAMLGLGRDLEAGRQRPTVGLGCDVAVQGVEVRHRLSHRGQPGH